MPNSSNFSVIIPSFNRGPLLPFTLDAIVGQRLPPAEVIVADDGSTDNTAEIVERYGHPVRLLRLTNGGPAAARHAGVLSSRSELIAFCDSDDVWRPDHLWELGDLFQKSQVPFAFTNFVHIRNNKWETTDKFADAPSGYWSCANRPINAGAAVADEPLFAAVLEFQPVFQSCIAMTRQFYDHVGGYNSAFGRLPSEDLEFTLRCVREAPIGIVLRPTVGIRRHAGNDSTNVVRQLNGEIEILEWSKMHHCLRFEWSNGIDRQVTARAIQAFNGAFAANDLTLARKFIPRITLQKSSFKLQLKILIARLPDEIGRLLCSALTGHN